MTKDVGDLVGWSVCQYKDLLEYLQPTKYIVESTKYNDKYKTPVLTAGKSFIKGYTNELEGVFENLPTIIFDDFTTASRYVNFPFKVKSSAMKILVPSCKLVNLKFVFYCMQNDKIRSDTHKRYWISVYSIKELGLPPLAEQNRIVAKIEQLFSELDKGIESLKKSREQLKVYRQAILKHAFEGQLTEKWREQNKDKLVTSEQLLTHIQKEREECYKLQLEKWNKAVENWNTGDKKCRKPIKPKQPVNIELLSEKELSLLPSLPGGYIYTKLENLGNLGRGKSKHRPRNAPQLFGGKYPFVQTGEVKAANRIIKNFTQTYSEIGLAQSKLWPEGTLCITIAANIAETAFLGFDGCFPDSVVGFSAFDKIVRPEYVELFIKAVRVRIEAYAPATAQKNINLTTLENLVVPVCSIKEQEYMINKLESVFSVIDKNEVEIESNLKRADALGQSILKKAFSGLLVEQDLNDEPASVLLEKIKMEREQQAQSSPKKKVGKKITNSRKTAA